MIKRSIRAAYWVTIFVFSFAIFTNIWVVLSTRDQILESSELTGNIKTALILGTSYNTVEGEKNPFFYSRIKTAISLYENDIATSFILSGSATDYYNEPRVMVKSLSDAGIPKTVLTQDSLGVRTLSSIIRCKEVYKQESIIIITQKFHAYRALFISNFYGIEAVVVATEDVGSSSTFGVLVREFLARPLAVIDLYILNSRP